MKKTQKAPAVAENKLLLIECVKCHHDVDIGRLSDIGPICLGCVEEIRSNTMAKKNEVSGKKKGTKVPKPVTLREKGIGKNLCVNIPVLPGNKAMIEGIATFRTAYGISLNDLLFLALAKYLKLDLKYFK